MRTIPEIHRPLLDPGIGAPVDASISEYVNIHDYLQIIYRRRWIIVGIIALGVGGAALLNWMTTPMFGAQATLQIDVDPNVLGVDRPLIPLDQRDWMKEFLPTQLAILESNALARAAYDELKQADRSDAHSNEPTDGSTPMPFHTTNRPLPTVGEIVAGRSVSLVKDTRLVNVGFISSDPVVATNVANALAWAYVQQNFAVRSKATGDASDWLVKQVDQQRKLVNESEAALQRYRKDHGADALFTDKVGVEQQNIVVQKLGALQAAATKAHTDAVEKESLYRQLLAVQANQEPLDTMPAIASNTYIQGLKVELTGLQRQMVQASKELGEQHPEFIKLQGSVQNAERKLQMETSNVAAAIRNDFEVAQSNERSLVAALERQKSEVQALNGKAVEYTALEREANSNREVLDKLLQRSREASLTRQLQTTNMRIVDQAQVPELPMFPRKVRNVAIGFVGSGALALALVFVLEIFNASVMSPADVERHLRIRVLGVAPEVKPLEGRASLLLGSGAPTQFAELLQGLRTNVVTAPGLATGRTLLVTSSEPSEGKTISAANLAVSLAGLSQRVLLIDADLRKPRLHDVFGEAREPGLADVLKGKTTTHDFRKTKVRGLWLMPAGTASQNAANLLGSSNFTKLIDYLQGHFDWIVLDSPPVMAVTDPCLVARAASGVLLVVDCRRTAKAVASAAVERLDAVGATIIGAMLNRVSLDRRSQSYLPYYHKDYETYYPDADDSYRPPDLSPASLNRDAAAQVPSTVGPDGSPYRTSAG